METDLITRLIFEKGLCQPLATKDLNADEILSDDILLAEVAGMNERALTALIKARINSLALVLVQNASPAEVIIFRQAMLEVAMILDDQIAYANEAKRRDELKKQGGQDEQPTEEAAPTAEDNVPGTTAVL